MQAKGKVCKQRLRKLFKAFPSFLSFTQGIYSVSRCVLMIHVHTFFSAFAKSFRIVAKTGKKEHLCVFDPHTLTRFLIYCLPFCCVYNTSYPCFLASDKETVVQYIQLLENHLN